MSKASRRNDQYEGEKEGYSVWEKRVERNRKNSDNAEKELYYKKGFLPETIEGLDIKGDDSLNYISLRDYLQITYAAVENMKLLKNSVTRVSYELEEKNCDYTLRLYVRKEVGQLPTVLDAFLYDMKNGAYIERLQMDGDLTPKAGFSKEDVVSAYQRISQVLHEDESVRFAAFEYVKVEEHIILNQMFLYPPYPTGVGFSEGTNEYLTELRERQIWIFKRYRKSKFSRRFHRLLFNFKRLKLVSKGFTAKRAEIWLLKQAVDEEMMKAEPASELRFAKDHGFTLKTVKKLGINKDNVEDFVSEKELQSMYRDRAYIKLYTGDHKGALDDFLHSGKIEFNDYLKMAMLFKVNGNLKYAISYCNAILDVDFKAYAGYACLADIYTTARRPEIGIRVWDLSIDRSKNNPRAYVERAKLKQMVGDTNGYEQDIKTAKELLPTVDLNYSITDEALHPKVLRLPIR